MALHVTQCPRCESTFNTSASMLQAAHGLVRCGACLSIFEADQHFVHPLPAASNDESGDASGESVFISAPEEYFDPAEFLNHGEQAEGDEYEDDPDNEPLYAKSDVHDSSFDVFDVDPALEDSRIHEQVLDSDFDVFDVGDVREIERQAKADIQDNEFDIYDAGERVLTARPEPHEGEKTARLAPTGKRSFGHDEPFQLKATFSFSPGMPQAILIPTPDAEVDDSRRQQAKSTPAGIETDFDVLADHTEKTLPPELLEDGFVILPEGPDAATLLKELTAGEDTEVILPAGPDAATLLAELKEANRSIEQPIKKEEEHSARDSSETLDGEPAFLPDQEPLAETDSADSIDRDFDCAAGDFSAALAEGLEWEEADVEVDESSFVILPADPYQPSAFKDLAGDQTVQPLDEEEALDDLDAIKEIEALEQREDWAAKQEQESNGSATATPNEKSIPRHETDEQPDVPTLTDFASEPKRSLANVEQADTAAGGTKDMIRSHVMATELEQHDESREQLSEENLRAVRDVDTALELEQHRKNRSSRTGLVVGSGLLLILLSSVVFFWLRMPELSQDPRFRSWYQSSCNLIGCNLPDYVNPGQVETSNLVVRSHPQRENTLELTAVFRNAAQFPQPFPLIELTFSDLNNSPMMVFEFLPDEYLPQALRGMPLMPVGAPVQITLELPDPGTDAVNYQMNYRAAPPRPR